MQKRSRAFYFLAAFFTAFVLFLYGPIVTIGILSFQGPQGGLTFPMNETSLHWFFGEFRSEVQHRGQIWYLSDAQRETVSPCRTIRISRPAREIRSLP